jgi:hypothetical protein
MLLFFIELKLNGEEVLKDESDHILSLLPYRVEIISEILNQLISEDLNEVHLNQDVKLLIDRKSTQDLIIKDYEIIQHYFQSLRLDTFLLRCVIRLKAIQELIESF